MEKVILFTIIFLSACGPRIQTEQFIQNESLFEIPINAPRNNNSEFNNVLPIIEDYDELSQQNFIDLDDISFIFPRDDELQNCIGSILVIVAGVPPKVNFLPMAICFNNRNSNIIPFDTRRGLRGIITILNRNPDNHIMLLIPDEIRNRNLASRRIQTIRNFLISEGLEQTKIMILTNTPPE